MNITDYLKNNYYERKKAFAIHNVSNSALLEAFEDAVCDRNYNPTNDNYHKSGYTYAELKAEIVDRLQGGEQLRIE